MLLFANGSLLAGRRELVAGACVVAFGEVVDVAAEVLLTKAAVLAGGNSALVLATVAAVVSLIVVVDLADSAVLLAVALVVGLRLAGAASLDRSAVASAVVSVAGSVVVSGDVSEVDGVLAGMPFVATSESSFVFSEAGSVVVSGDVNEVGGVLNGVPSVATPPSRFLMAASWFSNVVTAPRSCVHVLLPGPNLRQFFTCFLTMVSSMASKFPMAPGGKLTEGVGTASTVVAASGVVAEGFTFSTVVMSVNIMLGVSGICVASATTLPSVSVAVLTKSTHIRKRSNFSGLEQFTSPVSWQP